jgi:hypothetical protein
MDRFADLKIASKILVLIALLGVISILATLLATTRMHGINQTYSDLISGPAKASIEIARANRALVSIERGIFLLDTQTSDTGNQRALADIHAAEKTFTDLGVQVKHLIPEQTQFIDQITERYQAAMAGACGKSIE